MKSRTKSIIAVVVLAFTLSTAVGTVCLVQAADQPTTEDALARPRYLR